MRFAFCLLAVFAAGPSVSSGQATTPAPATAATPIAQDPREIARRVEDHIGLIMPFGFSGAALLAKDGRILLSEGYGMADREAGIPVLANTVFDIGSITKQFTAAAVLRLEMEGKLSVHDPLTRWFEGVPADKRAITLHHLLTHTAGLRDTFGGDYDVAERDSLARVILRSRLLAPAPAPYAYSNAGYTMLAIVIEKAAGVPYERYLREKLFEPAGMTRTGYRLVEWNPAELAVGYRRDTRWGTPLDHRWAADGPYWNLRGNGGILSTLPDLYRWHRALEGENILSAEAKAKMFTPHVPEDPEGRSHYGYGWAIFTTTRGTQLVAHDGSNGIFFADFRRYVDEGVVFLIVSNNADASASAAQVQLLRLIFGGDYREPPLSAADAPPGADALAGSYRLPDGGTMRVTVSDVRMRVTPGNQAVHNLLRGTDRPPRFDARNPRPVEFRPASATDWVTYDFATGTTVRMRSAGRALVIQTTSGPVRAERVR